MTPTPIKHKALLKCRPTPPKFGGEGRPVLDMVWGFTLIEVLISITIFILITTTVLTVYFFHQRLVKDSQSQSEVTQNGRVITEKLTREIRQTKEIVTELCDPIDSQIPKSSSLEIEFEDGHIQESYHYIYYFLDGNLLKREVIGYYFSGDESQTLVPWNSIPPAGQELKSKVLEEEKMIAEHIKSLNFWGEPTVYLFLSLEKGDSKVDFFTKIFARNL